MFDDLKTILRKWPHINLPDQRLSDLEEPTLAPSIYAGSAVVNLLALALPLAILQIYDRVLPNASFETLTVMIIALIGVVAVDGVLKYCRAYLINWAAASFTHTLSVKALRVMMATPPSRYNQAPASEHLERLNSISGLGDYLGGQSRVVFVDILFIPIFAGVIILVGGLIFFVPLLLFAAFGYFALRRTEALRAAISEREKSDARKYDFVIEILQAMQTIKSLAMEPLMMRRFERLQSGASVVVRRLIQLTGATQNFSALYASLSVVAVVCIGALFVLNGQLTIGGLACCMLLSSQLLQPLLRSLSAWNEVNLASHRRERIMEIFDGADATIKGASADMRCFSANSSAKGVELKNVTIRHGAATPLFRNINMTAPAGALIAVRGADGSGRTSLLRAIIGDIAPVSGEIRVGGTLIDRTNTSALRSSTRYVSQTPTTFRGTILENLTIFGELPTASALWASKLIGLDEEVIRMPLGYDTPLRSAAGLDIPAATAQRICIARALATKPSVLALDEANTSLDMQGEKFLSAALQKLRGSITIIIATHRPSLVKLADGAYDISRGALIPVSAPAPKPKTAQL